MSTQTYTEVWDLGNRGRLKIELELDLVETAAYNYNTTAHELCELVVRAAKLHQYPVYSESTKFEIKFGKTPIGDLNDMDWKLFVSDFRVIE